MLLKKVVLALEKYSIRYALVGGYAVALHGVVRGTLDIDLVIQMNEASFVAAEKALGEIGLEPRLPVTASEVFRFRREYQQKRNLIAWGFVNPQRPSEMVDILITQGAEKMKTVVKHVGQLPVRVASIPELIKMKQKSGRPQDLEDIRSLEEIR